MVVIESNDHTLDDLVVFGDLLPYETHVAQHLANDDITGPATLQLDHEQTLLVLADREDIDWPCVSSVLLANWLSVLLINRVVLGQQGLIPVRNQK